jgi:EmrB/QacA subfamily drug resistance transporter
MPLGSWPLLPRAAAPSAPATIPRCAMEYKWKAFSVTAVGSFMAGLDATVVLLALLPIAKDLHTDYVTIIWVVLAYLLATTALVLSFGRISDIYGRKRMYNIGFVIFTVGSLFSGLSTSGLMLVVARVVQGIGAAFIFANGFAILSDAFPEGERGRAFGATSVIWGLASVIGIILGAVIVSFTTWRWIFLLNLPVGVVGTLWAYYTLRESGRTASEGESFDLPAAVLFTAGLTALLLGVTSGLLYGWTSAATLLELGLAPLLFAGFVLWELRYAKQPIIDFSFFKSRPFTLSVSANFLRAIAMFSVNFLLVFYLEGIYGLSILTASYLIVPYAAALAVVGPFGGILTDRFGARRLCTWGLLLQIASILALSRLSTSTPLWLLGVMELGIGVGGGLFWPANASLIMTSSPRRRFGIGSGIMNTFQNTGNVLSFAVSLVAITAGLSAPIVYALFLGTFSGRLPAQAAAEYLSAESLSFLISAALLVGALVLVLLIPSTTPKRPDVVSSMAGAPGSISPRSAPAETAL